MANHWYQNAASLMVRTGKNLWQASVVLNLGLTVKQATEIEDDPEFMAVLRGERFKYYKEIYNDPNKGKAAVIGQMLDLATKLTKEKKHKEAVTALLGVAKVEGWLTDNTQIQVFGDVSAKDISSMKEKLEKAKVQPLAN